MRISIGICPVRKPARTDVIRCPTPTCSCRTFSDLGISNGTQVVAYDADSGMYAGRLWWMLRWMGHDAAAVLDGGLARWQREGHAVRGGVESSTLGHFKGAPRPGWRLSVDEVAGIVGDPTRLLVDSRTPDRYRGIGETLDKVGGHIPGAANYFFQQNLTADKTFKSADDLQHPVGRGDQGPRPQGCCGVLRVGRHRLP